MLYLQRLKSLCRGSYDAALLEQKGLRVLLKDLTVAGWYYWGLVPDPGFQPLISWCSWLIIDHLNCLRNPAPEFSSAKFRVMYETKIWQVWTYLEASFPGGSSESCAFSAAPICVKSSFPQLSLTSQSSGQNLKMSIPKPYRGFQLLSPSNQMWLSCVRESATKLLATRSKRT